jgi:hypothetical protein
VNLKKALKTPNLGHDVNIEAAMKTVRAVRQEHNNGHKMKGDCTTANNKTPVTAEDQGTGNGDQGMVGEGKDTVDTDKNMDDRGGDTVNGDGYTVCMDREDHHNNIRAPDLDQFGIMADNEDQDFEDALRVLVRQSIEQFGYAPRDVHNGVFIPLEWTCKHLSAVEDLNYTELRRLTRLADKQFTFEGFSHRVIVVDPIPFTNSQDLWRINFKSVWIAKIVVESMGTEEDRHLRETCDLLHSIPAAASMAGWYFESFVHRILTHGWDGPALQPIRMAPHKSNSRTFVADSPSPPDTFHDPVRSVARTTKRVVLDAKILSDITLEKNIYYTPSTTKNPPFDSFTIDHHPDQCTVVISIFQITISPSHRGSDKGLLNIQNIMRRVYWLLEDVGLNDTTVKVAYFLVCLERKSDNRWRMPKRWTTFPKGIDHRGEFFCIRIPNTNLGASCTSIPILQSGLIIVVYRSQQMIDNGPATYPPPGPFSCFRLPIPPPHCPSSLPYVHCPCSYLIPCH